MSGDNTERMLGQLDGKLDSLISSFKEYREAHDLRHTKIDEQLTAHAADINKAKGAKAAVFAGAAVLATFVSAAWAAVAHFIGK